MPAETALAEETEVAQEDLASSEELAQEVSDILNKPVDEPSDEPQEDDAGEQEAQEPEQTPEQQVAEGPSAEMKLIARREGVSDRSIAAAKDSDTLQLLIE